MTTATFQPAMPAKLHFRDNLTLWIPTTQCRLMVSSPRIDPTLWNQYLDGALRTYAKHGVERTLGFEAICDGADTEVFFAAVDSQGKVVGGARAVGPLRSADDSHAVVEWAGSPGEPVVRKVIDDRVPFGVVEVKAAWVDSDFQHGGLIAAALARVALPIMALLDVQFVMATAASHVLDRWRSSGGVVATAIPAVAYPDERYRTKMMWWDRTTLAEHAEPKQLSRMLGETDKLVRQAEEWHEMTAASGAGG